jgi:small GTP-binding protein
MIQKKICMLGTYAVGKTSLVRQYVESIFSEKYQTTLGVKIDKKMVQCGGKTVNLLLWDIQGEDEFKFKKVTGAYIRGAAGYLLVVDSTRPETLEKVLDIQQRTAKIIGDVPFVILLNKVDLTEHWALPEEQLAALNEKNWPVIRTSAKTGSGVEDAFGKLTELIMNQSGKSAS